MKRWILLLIVVLSVLLASCKANTTTDTTTTATPAAAGTATAKKAVVAEKVIPSKYEYKTVLAYCTADKSTPNVVCKVNKQKGEAYIDSIVADTTANGWELINAINDGPHYAFFFKRDK
jgi:hypothetical protein